MTRIDVKVEMAIAPLKCMMGLMFRKTMPADHVLIMDMKRDVKYTVHMLFMRFRIDVVFANKAGRILEIHRDLKPWIGLARPQGPYRYVLEMPAGAMERHGLKEGDFVIWDRSSTV